METCSKRSVMREKCTLVSEANPLRGFSSEAEVKTNIMEFVDLAQLRA